MAQLQAMFNVAGQSLRYRFGGVLLTVVSVALSVFVLLAVEHVRQETRSGFASTVAGVDLIVGARTGEINLLLLSVFRIGNATANVTEATAHTIEQHERVEWVVPISLGDSHGGFRVVGTTAEFFDRYRYGRSQSLQLSEGRRFSVTEDIVLGSTVARELGYGLGDELVLSHGVADTSFMHHDEQPFAVSGILAPTGTPVDNALFASLEAIDAIHEDGDHDDHGGADEHGHDDDAEAHADEHGHDDDAEAHADEHGHDDDAEAHAVEHGHDDDDEAHADEHGHDDDEAHADEHAHESSTRTVTALLVGLDQPFATLQVQRWINEYTGEALLAILPGVALAQLWEMLGTVEDTLRGISILVFVSALFGMIAMLLASMRERGREIEILRSIGAPSAFIVGLLIVEALLIVSVGILAAISGLLLAIALVNSTLANEIGLSMSMQIFYPSSLTALGLIYLTTIVLSLVPAWRAYRISRSIGGQTSAM